MFYTFSSATTAAGRNAQHRAKRFKVRRACNYCRQHRVRCDAESPCSRCVANNTECVVSSPQRKDKGSEALSQNESLRPMENHSFDLLQAGTVADGNEEPTTLSSASLAVTTPSVPNLHGKQPVRDSTVGFMSKINTFYSTMLSTDTTDESPPPYPSLERPLVFKTATKGSSTILSKPQVLRLLDIYWVKCHNFYPVIVRSQIETLCQTLWDPDGSELQTSRLIDGMLAICLNHLESSGLDRRLVGLTKGRDGLSIAYFRRCLSSTTQFATFADPALDHVQCYVLMTVYLLETGQHQPAYSMIGLALRIAHALNLHQGLPETDPNSSLGRRLWWTVLHLDFRCARLVGRPVGVQLADTTCELPSIDEFAYHTRAVSLTGVILAVNEALSQHLAITTGEGIQQIESRASSLSAEMYQLKDWEDQFLAPALQRPLHVAQKGNHDWVHEAGESNSSQFLYGVLSELQYYDEIIGLHRPFICFPNGSLVPQQSPEADAHATTALKYAMATVDLVHRLMSVTDVLYGRSEVYQWQWNALLTLIGFLMAYPLCVYGPSAQRHTQLAVEIFTAADPKNSVAFRAAALGRSLCAKLDNLVQILKPDNNPMESATSKDTNGNGFDEAGSSASENNPNVNTDALWSWTDMTNPNVWSAYSDGVTGVLADFSHNLFGNDGFSPI